MARGGDNTILKLQAVVTAITKQAERAFRALAKDVGVLDKEHVQARKNTERFGRATDKSAKSAKRYSGAATQAGKATLGWAAAMGALVVGLGKAAEHGGRMVTMMDAFQRTTGDSSGSLTSMRVATRGLISDFALLEQFNRGVALGAVKTRQEFNQLAQAAITLGRAMNTDAAFALESLTLGIGRQSRLFLDNLGLIVKVEEAYRRYGLAVGKTGDQLTETQQKEAFRIETFRKMDEAMRNLGDITLNAGDAFTQLSNDITNAKNELFSMLARSNDLASFFNILRDGVARGVGIVTGISPEVREISEQWALMANTQSNDILPVLDEIVARYDKLTEGKAPILFEEGNLEASIRSFRNAGTFFGKVIQTSGEGLTAVIEGFAGAAGVVQAQNDSRLARWRAEVDAATEAWERQVGEARAVGEFAPAAPILPPRPDLTVGSRAVDLLAEQFRDMDFPISAEMKEMIDDSRQLENIILELERVSGLKLTDPEFQEFMTEDLLRIINDASEGLKDIGVPPNLIELLNAIGVMTPGQLFAEQAPFLALGLDMGAENMREVVFLAEEARSIAQEMRATGEEADETGRKISFAFATASELVDRAAKAVDAYRTAHFNMAKAVDTEKQEEFRSAMNRSTNELKLFTDELVRRGQEGLLFTEQALGISFQQPDDPFQELRGQIDLAHERAAAFEDAIRGAQEAVAVAGGTATESVLGTMVALEGLIVQSDRFQRQGEIILVAEESLVAADKALESIEQRWKQLQRPGQFDAEALQGLLQEAVSHADGLASRLALVEAVLGDDHDSAKKLRKELERARDVADDMTDASLPFFDRIKNLFSGSADSLFSTENLTNIGVEAIGGLLSSGLTSVVSVLGAGLLDVGNQILQGLTGTGKSAEERSAITTRDNIKAIEKNTEAINKFSRAMGGSEFSKVIDVLRVGAGIAAGGDSTLMDTDELLRFTIALEAAGLTLDDLRQVFESNGLDFTLSMDGLTDAANALEDQFASLGARMFLANARIEAFDLDRIEDGVASAEAQFAEWRKALAESVDPKLGLSIARLTVDNIDEFVQGVLNSIEAGTFDFSLLGGVSTEDFIAALLQMEGLGDAAEDASKGLSQLGEVLRNVPSGFKVALEQFRATTGEFLDNTILGEGSETFVDPIGDGTKGGDFGTPIVEEPLADLDTMGFDAAVNNFGEAVDIFRDSGSGTVFDIDHITIIADDPDALADELADRSRREVRRGGVGTSELTSGGTGSEATKGGFRA